jgi:hypothetical protein
VVRIIHIINQRPKEHKILFISLFVCQSACYFLKQLYHKYLNFFMRQWAKRNDQVTFPEVKVTLIVINKSSAQLDLIFVITNLQSQYLHNQWNSSKLMLRNQLSTDRRTCDWWNKESFLLLNRVPLAPSSIVLLYEL